MEKIVIFGLARSNIAVINFLSKLDCKLQIHDDKKAAIDNIQNLPNITKCYDINDINWDGVSKLILSPGVPLYFPKPHKIVQLANHHKIQIISDIEYFYHFFPKQNYIAVTGSNGKSTVTNLIAKIFANSKKKYDFGGNIGRAIFDMDILPENSHYILELSSYQLDLIYQTKLKIAILLNITPDHLERHGNFENYITSKKRIFQNQDQEDYAIIGVDNKETAKIYQELKEDNDFKARLIAFSNRKILKDGFAIVNQIIYQDRKEIANLQEKILIKGEHNLENILASFIAAYLSGISIEIIIKTIAQFTGLKHRMEFVRKIDNVNFINDSKATNLQSAIMAIKNFKNIYLILGGKIKDDDFNLLQNYHKNITKCYLIGDSSNELYDILSDKIDCIKSVDLKSAIDQSYQDAKYHSGQSCDWESNILLSPLS